MVSSPSPSLGSSWEDLHQSLTELPQRRALVSRALAPVSSSFNSSSSSLRGRRSTPCADFVAGTALCEPPCADFVAGAALCEPPCADFVAGAALCEPPCAEFVADTALCEPRCADCVAGTALCEPPCFSEPRRGSSAERRFQDSLAPWSDHGRNRPSIVIRVFSCFFKCRFRGRHSTL